MSLPGIPVIEYPLGSEKISTKIVEVKWKSPNVTIGQFDPVYYYEIYYRTSDVISYSTKDWKRISRVPSSVNKYNWVIPEYLFGAEIFIGIRSVNQSGQYSEYSASGVFSILPKPLPKISISNPVSGKIYGSQIDIQLQNSMISEDSLKLNRYRINLYYSSQSNDISYAPIVERVSGSTSQVIWNTSQLNPGQDYFIYGFYSDDFGRKGPQTSIGPFAVENQGYVIIDTDGPEVALKISSNNGFVRDRTVGLELFAYDDVSGIHGFKLIENIRKNDGSLEEKSDSEPRFYQKNNFLQLSDQDARFVITSLVEDIAGNRANDADASLIKVGNKFRKFYNRNGFKITSWAKTQDTLYVCIYDGQFTQVLKILDGKINFVSSFVGLINVLSYVGGKLYGSKFNQNRLLELVAIESNGLVPVVSLLSPDTEISAMIDSEDGGILLGCINGEIYRLFNQSLQLISNVNISILGFSKGQFNSVFILTNSSEKVFIYKDQNINTVEITI
jgi:hypothetical protein